MTTPNKLQTQQSTRIHNGSFKLASMMRNNQASPIDESSNSNLNDHSSNHQQHQYISPVKQSDSEHTSLLLGQSSDHYSSTDSPLSASLFVDQSKRRQERHRNRKLKWFWNRQSEGFRFFILAVAVLIPFGGHIVKYSLSALATPLLSDPNLHLTHTEFGTFQSAVSIPNLFVPFLGGLLLDLRDSRYGILLFLSLCTIGHLMFTLAIQSNSYRCAVAARILFGLGQGSTVVAQSHIAATYFAAHELVLAVALSESMHNVSGWISKVYVVPMSKWNSSARNADDGQVDDYMSSLWAGVAFTCVSLAAGLVYFYLDPLMADPKTQAADELALQDSPLVDFNGQLRRHSIQTVQQKLQMHRASSRSPPTANSSDNASMSNHSYQTLLDESKRQQQLSEPLSTTQYLSANNVNGGISNQHHSTTNSGSVSPALSSVSSTPSLTKSSFSQLFQYNQFTVGFVILCILHLLFSNLYHLFDYISVHFLETKYHTDTRVAAFYSSITSASAIFLCPLAGYMLDRFGGKMYVCVTASICTTIAYLLFIYTQITPVIPLLLLSLCVSFVPTILRSSVPDLISRQSSHECRVVLFATAYGVYEICESIGAVIGHTSVGYVVDQNQGDYTADLWIFVAMSVIAFVLTTSLCIWDSYVRAEGAVINLSTKAKQVKMTQECNDAKVTWANAQHNHHYQTIQDDDELTDAESHNANSTQNGKQSTVYGAV